MAKILKKDGYIIDSPDYANDYHVYQDYTATLNQTDLRSNNNKYYILQLLENDSRKDDYLVFTRWGRIGNKGTVKVLEFTNSASAVREFEKTFKTKTGNYWRQRNQFQKKTGKYFMSQIDYQDDEQEEVQDTKKPTSSIPDSKLDPRIRKLIELISNINIINYTMKEFNIDVKKMPLGKISKEQIEQGYEILKKIADLINQNIPLVADEYIDLTSQFYTLIPSSFGRKKPPVIGTDEQVKKYSDMLNVLTDLEVAGSILNMKNSKKLDLHPADRIYQQLNIDLSPLSLAPDSNEFLAIKRYINNTTGGTHNSYRLELLDVIKVNREEENKRFVDYGNRQLLFHGSRVANFVGILSQGLRINSNAPKTGSMFGPGSYFSNCVTKSANYCYTDPSNDIGVMLLCDVSLGNTYNKVNSEYITWLPNDQYQSTWGQGTSVPDPNDYAKFILDGQEVLVPNGKLTKSKNNAYLLYDEFIVYRENQVRIKYAMKLRFNYDN